MTDQAAYRRYTAEAETALTRAGQNMSAQDRLSWTRLGNAWATLALAAAQERVQPADRPTDDKPRAVKDNDGDVWSLVDDDTYRCAISDDKFGLEELGRRFGPLTILE